MSDALERRAVAAAVAVAAKHGLSDADAVVVRSGSNVLVHLRPLPIVARVMTGTVALHDDPERWLRREVSVVGFLAATGLAVTPSPLIDAGPHHHDGLWLTFVAWVPDVGPTDATDPHRLGRALRDLHDALAPFDGDLAGLRDLRHDIERLLGLLRPADAREAAAVEALRRRLEATGPSVFDATLPVRALHGDASLSNLLRTPEGLVWNDFEDTFRGPVHWDVAGFAIALRNRGAGPDAVSSMLAAYGWDDEEELAPFTVAHGVYDEIWSMYDRQRRR